jgi:hypothetical protein
MFKHKFVKIIIWVILFFLLIFILLWAFSFKRYNVDFGISFSKEYTQSLGLDWKETYDAIFRDLRPHYIRLAIPWSMVERESNQFNFDDIDYQINVANQNNTKVVLTIGQKVPRWPECYIPEWAETISQEDRDKELLSYIRNTVERYKGYSNLEYWQVENEPYIPFNFGECKIFNQSVVIDEVNLVHTLDPTRKIIVTDSGELSSWHKASIAGDIFGTTLYRTVQNPLGFTIRYVLLPPAFYTFRARLWDNSYDNFFVSELQAEPWFTNSNPTNTPVTIQEKTGSLKQIEKNIEYSHYVGASRVYLWGVEWWYYMMEKQNDPSYWDMIMRTLAN